jgi:hypothetical protein
MSSMLAVKTRIARFLDFGERRSLKRCSPFLKATTIDVSLRYDFRGDAGSASKRIGKLSRWSLLRLTNHCEIRHAK